MKRAFYIFIFLIALALAYAVGREKIAPRPNLRPDIKADNSETSRVDSKDSGGQSESSGSDRIESLVAPSNAATPKSKAVQDTLMEQNARILDLYGMVMDQDGQPVAGATVEGSILLNVSLASSGGETHFTETDGQGRFKFLGVHGVKMGIRPKKEGYYYDPKLPSSRPDDYFADPDHPLMFRMWKILGQETLVNSNMEFPIAFDGTPFVFDLATQTQDANGDVKIGLTRSPTQVKRSGQKFDWTLNVEMIRGGIIANDDSYSFWAPEAGYASSYQLNVSSNDIPWRSTFVQNFYVKDAKGQFGRLRINVYAGLTPARIRFDLSINPSGSQNLEPDLKKQAE